MLSYGCGNFYTNAKVMKPMRQFLGLFDEDQSNENAKHIVRTMRENPWPDFLNGSRLPFGYRVKEANRC